MDDSQRLIDAARQAVRHSYSPYSHFAVGAALLASDGTIATGCNIENASYGATVCAERTAVFKAVSGGMRSFTALALVAQTPVPPCALCLQVLAEFCSPDLPIYAAAIGPANPEVRQWTLGQLLPEAFRLND